MTFEYRSQATTVASIGIQAMTELSLFVDFVIYQERCRTVLIWRQSALSPDPTNVLTCGYCEDTGLAERLRPPVVLLFSKLRFACVDSGRSMFDSVPAVEQIRRTTLR